VKKAGGLRLGEQAGAGTPLPVEMAVFSGVAAFLCGPNLRIVKYFIFKR
jgi:hypothetical protein